MEQARREENPGGVSVAEADDFEVTRLAHTLFILLVALVALVWSQRRQGNGGKPKASAPPPPPQGPTMAIPKGRVR